MDGSLVLGLSKHRQCWQRSLAEFVGSRSFFERALPLLLLVATLSTVFLFDRDRGHFGRGDHPDWLMSQHLAQAANLSLKHRFLLFIDRTYDVDGDVSHVAYARWPIGSYALVKLALLLSGGDLGAGIYAARIVMLLLFIGSCVFAYLAFARLTDRWIALVATLLVFSSHTALQYSDVFAPDVVPALFGLMLTFHGMVVFAHEGRFAQLLAKSSIALFLCWHVYAVLLPFIVLNIVRELVGTARTWGGLAMAWQRCRGALLASPYVKLGAYAFGLGVFILATNIANEYFSYGAKIPLNELSLLKSAVYRLGFDEAFNERTSQLLDWGPFLKWQLHRVAGLTLSSSFAALNLDGLILYGNRLYSVGMIILFFCLVGLVFSRNRVLFASLLVSGIVWALAVRGHVAAHNFQSLFYIGIPLVAFSFAGKYSSPLLVRVCVPVAIFLFVLSSVEMNQMDQGSERVEREDEVIKDFQTIRNIVGEGAIFIATSQESSDYGGAPFAVSYFMSGSIIGYGEGYFNVPPNIISTRLDLTDYFLTKRREDIAALITPRNRHFFVYDRTCVPRASPTLRAWACGSSPFVPFSSTESGWEVHFDSGHLVLSRDECLASDEPIFVHYVPADREHLPVWSRSDGIIRFEVPNPKKKAIPRGHCATVVALPDIKLEHIRVGQSSWSAESKVYYWESDES